MCSSKKPNNTGHCIDHPRLLCRVKRWKFTVGTLVRNKRWFHRHSIGPLRCCVAPLSDAVVIARTGLTTYEPLYWATVDCGGTAVRSQGIKRPQCHFMLRYQCGKFPIARSAHSLVQRALHIHGFRSPMHGRNELVARVDVRSRRCGREAAPWGGNIVGRTTCATTPPGNNSVLLPSLNGNDIDWRISSDFFFVQGNYTIACENSHSHEISTADQKKKTLSMEECTFVFTHPCYKSLVKIERHPCFV